MPRLRVKSPAAKQPALIGWRERVRLPDLGIGSFIAKIDTGANYCALHATEIKPSLKGVTFRFQDSETLSADLIKKVRIASSNGETTARPLICIRIKIGNKLISALVTLIDRSSMKDKMLIGRRFLSGRFIVDSRLQYALTAKKKKRKAK